MRLRDLDAQFVYNATAKSFCQAETDSVEGMQGILFQCPHCAIGKARGVEGNRGYVEGAHSVLIFFANPRGTSPAPPEASPRSNGTPNPQWTMSGSTIDDLTLSPSVDLSQPWQDEHGVMHPSSCQWHGWVRNGDAS